MEKRISSRAIIIDNDQLLTMFRRKIKDGKTEEYYVIPGGGKEGNETLERKRNKRIKRRIRSRHKNTRLFGYKRTRRKN